MQREQADRYRAALRDLARRLEGTAAGLEEGARMALGGDAGGSLSNAPMHLGDIGTAAYNQELNATLLENEEFLRAEAQAAIDRIDQGTFGTCENCGAEIPAERLDILPYVRHCVPCAEKLASGLAVNLNDGRPQDRTGVINPRAEPPDTPPGGDTGDHPPLTDIARRPAPGDAADVHAVGTAGGGTAVGGLAGTNIGGGDPDAADLEEAMGSGNFDVELERDREAAAYSGPHGGAVGGTPANKRATGGKTGRGLAPRPDPGDSPTGP